MPYAAKNIKANFIACELLVKRVVTFGAALYHNQTFNFILRFLLNCILVDLSNKYFVWISFNCFF